jgi:flagellar biosynthesis protein FlhA
LVVGVVVFLILIIVQFVVINKGSERVAEVTARFTLDAMPGKQMAIDADLNTGAIPMPRQKFKGRSYRTRQASLVLWMVPLSM